METDKELIPEEDIHSESLARATAFTYPTGSVENNDLGLVVQINKEDNSVTEGAEIEHAIAVFSEVLNIGTGFPIIKDGQPRTFYYHSYSYDVVDGYNVLILFFTVTTNTLH